MGYKNPADMKRKILKEFTVPITPEISSRIDELQNDDIALEQYVHTLIKNHLYKGDD